MAAVDTSAIASTLTTKFEPQIISQINRATVVMQVLPTGNGTTGKRLDWGVRFGSAVATARNEGADVATYNSDTKVPATLEFANIDDAVQITGKSIRAAAAAGNPEQLASLFNEEMGESIERMAKGVAGEIWTGDGTTNHIAGLLSTSGPLDATGTYANVARGTYSQWASNVLSNGGVARALTVSLMRRMRRTIYEASGRRPDLILCAPSVHERYGETFSQQRRWVDQIRLRGQTIKLDGGYQMLEFDGIPIIEDADCTDGVMTWLNTSFLGIKQLPDVGQGNPAQAQVQLRGTPEEQYGDRTVPITARVNPLQRAGDYIRFQLICYPQIQCRYPAAMGQIQDIDYTS